MRRRLQEEEPENVRKREVEKMYRASKILERMVNQNNLNDISVGKTIKIKLINTECLDILC